MRLWKNREKRLSRRCRRTPNGSDDTTKDLFPNWHCVVRTTMRLWSARCVHTRFRLPLLDSGYDATLNEDDIYVGVKPDFPNFCDYLKFRIIRLKPVAIIM